VSPRVAIVVLVVLVVFFAVAVASGLGRSDERGMSNPPDWTKALGGTFIHPEPVGAGDITSTKASCLVSGRIRVAVGASCAYKVASSHALQRKLKVSGTGLYALVPNLKGVDQNPTPKGLGDEIDIPQAGAQLSITCLPPVACQQQ
jgi:hypothetical protein